MTDPTSVTSGSSTFVDQLLLEMWTVPNLEHDHRLQFIEDYWSEQSRKRYRGWKNVPDDQRATVVRRTRIVCCDSVGPIDVSDAELHWLAGALRALEDDLPISGDAVPSHLLRGGHARQRYASFAFLAILIRWTRTPSAAPKGFWERVPPPPRHA